MMVTRRTENDVNTTDIRVSLRSRLAVSDTTVVGIPRIEPEQDTMTISQTTQ